MSTLAARRRRGVDFWPGFVDALSALLMVLVFLLLVFSVGQVALTDALSGRDRALDALNRELAELASALSMERGAKTQALTEVGELSASLSTSESARAQLQLDLDSTRTTLTDSEQQRAQLTADVNALAELKRQLEAELASRLAELEQNTERLVVQTDLSAKAAAQAELLNRQLLALREQMERIEAALATAETTGKQKDVEIAELGARLNLALADRVNELTRYRSEFFGKLRAALGNRADIQIVGDRFVVPSELLFPSASAELNLAGSDQLMRLAATLKEVTAQIPADIDWVLRIDGHTDRRPISTGRFPSNWELSSARAIAIVKFLTNAGIAPQRLAANGFGEHHPLDPGGSEEALARNRRIEIQLTNR
jgi:chemotaxis protein MotB